MKSSIALGAARLGIFLLMLFVGAATCWADSLPLISINVPAPNSFYTQNKSVGNGWGWIVLTFDRPIDGGSFIFNPDCPDPLDGVLSADKKTIRLGPGSYGIGPTGGASNTAGQTNKTLDVTIRFDIAGGKPNIVFDDGQGTPLSFWKAKPETATDPGFIFSPAAGRARNFDVALDKSSIVSESSSLLSLSVAFLAMFGVGLVKRL